MEKSVALLASGYGAVEGPTVDDAGDLYFSDPIDGGVYRRTAAGEIELVVPKRRGVGGLCLHRDGGVVVSGRDVSHVHDGESRILFGRDDYAALGLDPATSFNDIHADDRGRVLAGAVWGGAFDEHAKGALVLVEAPGRGQVIYDGVVGSNGIALDWKRRRLYHCSSYDQRIIVSEAAGDSYRKVEEISTKAVPGFPDGLALDDQGRLWVAFHRSPAVVCLDPAGRLLERLVLPSHDVTSLCFGGADPQDLIVVTGDNADTPALRGCVFRCRVDVRGAPVGVAGI
ncbi:MAG: hypothetical protein JWQ97_1902 [Phenylobacterium sp.]|nr:hypothetical protein [Phenylobacterium sp.]